MQNIPTNNSEKQCPFCSPEIKLCCFAESENFLAVYNIAPILPGHSMVIPKMHIEGFLDIDDNLMTEYVVFSRSVIKILNKAFKTDSFNWTIQDGIPAGQTIDHLHMHIIPRIEGDLADPGDWYPRLEANTKNTHIDSADRSRLSKEEMEKIVGHLKEVKHNLGMK